MAFIVDSGFFVTSALPADFKSIWNTTASLYSSSTHYVYPGGYISESFRYVSMEVYCRDDASTYKLIGGIDDSNWVKIMTGSLFISASNIISSSYSLSSSYSVSSSYASHSSCSIHAKTASYLNPGNYIITSSWSNNSLTSSYLDDHATASYAISSSYSITSSYSLLSYNTNLFNNQPASYFLNASNISNGYLLPSRLTGSYTITSSWSNNSKTASYIGTGTNNYVPKWNNNTFTATSLIYDNNTNVGIGTTDPQTLLHIFGNVSASNFLGNLIGTSSWSENSINSIVSSISNYASQSQWSVSSSFASNSISSSNADTLDGLHSSSFQARLINGNTYTITSSWSEYSVNSLSARSSSFASSSISSSYALTASYLNGYFVTTTAISSSWASSSVSSSNADTLDGLHSSSFQARLVTGNIYPITSSWSENSINALSALSASFASCSISSSYALTSSYSLTASYISGAFASTIAISCSWASSSLSSSYSLTASYLNGYFVTTTAISSSWASSSLTSSYQSNSFIYGGNSFGNIAYLGTNDNQPLYIKTNNSTQMVIDTSGSVGIHVQNPYPYSLYVSGSSRIQGDLTVNGTLSVIDTTTNKSEQILITNDGTGTGLVVNQVGLGGIADFQKSGSSIMYIDAITSKVYTPHLSMSYATASVISFNPNANDNVYSQNNSLYSSGSWLKYDGTILNVPVLTKEPTGFSSRANSSMSFDNTTKTFTIIASGSNSYNVYSIGKEYIKTGSAIVLTPTTGSLTFIYYDKSTIELASSISPWNLMDGTIPVATLYWSASGLLGEERHGIIMDGATHEYIHSTIGARYSSGLSGTFTAGTGSFLISSGGYRDEDIEHIIPDTTNDRILYRNGNTFTFTNITSSYYLNNGAATPRPYYDLNGTLTALTANGQYVAYFIVATNDLSCPIYSIMGQRLDTSLANARLNNTYESLVLGNVPFKEIKLLYRVILPGNPFSAGIIPDVTDYRTVSSGPGGTFVATSHGSLTGLNVDDHGQYLLLTGRSGQTISDQITVNGITSSLYGSSSYALSSSYAPIDPIYSASVSTVKQNTLITGNTYLITSSWSNNSISSISSSFASSSISSSYALTASYVSGEFITTNAISCSWASSSVSSSNADTLDGLHSSSFQARLVTGNIYPITSSWSNNSISSSYAPYFINTIYVSSGQTESLVIIPTTMAPSVHINYKLKNNNIYRAGSIICAAMGSNIAHNEYCTTDLINDSTGVYFQSRISAGNMLLELINQDVIPITVSYTTCEI